MKPVQQTKFSNPEGTVHGNCFAACIASILECGIEEVPPFGDMGNDWFNPFWNFLKDRGYQYHGMIFLGDKRFDTYQGVDGYYIVGGKSPRQYVTRGHAVVYQNGKMVHDPHPSGAGVLEVEDIYMIERCEPGAE